MLKCPKGWFSPQAPPGGGSPGLRRAPLTGPSPDPPLRMIMGSGVESIGRGRMEIPASVE